MGDLMVGRLRTLWRRLPIPHAAKARVHAFYGTLLEKLTQALRSAPTMPSKIERGPVIVSGFLSDVTGIGRAGRLTVDKLAQWGVPLITHDIRLDPGARALRQIEGGGLWVCHCNAPQVLEMLAQGADRIWAGRYRVGYWAYELETLPQDWQPLIPYFHEIWAPSVFVAQAIGRSPHAKGVLVRVVPHPLPDLSGISPNRELTGFADRFVFLTMLDARSSFGRKNPIGTLKAFQTAFAADDVGVALVIKVVAADAEPAAHKALMQQAEGWPNVRIVTEQVEDSEAVQLIASADCLVTLHRSEGFGLTIAEAMAVGTPVIATNWSGNVDFTRGGVIGIPYTLVPTEDPSGRYARKGACWAEPDLEAAAVAMRRIHDDAVLRAELTATARKLVRERLDIPLPSAPYERFIARPAAEATAGERGVTA